MLGPWIHEVVSIPVHVHPPDTIGNETLQTRQLVSSHQQFNGGVGGPRRSVKLCAVQSTTTNFNVDKNNLKLWYHVIEKALLFGAGVWGGVLTTEHVRRLRSEQRVFLLKFSRAYRTTSTQVLNVLIGIPPLHLTAKAEFQKFQARACRSTELGRLLDINNLDCYIKLTDVHIELRTLDIIPKVLNKRYEVYTDGSKIGDDTGFSVCILKNGETI
ncbi:hypothetical protein AVEN_114973-1 [Araneus ventricosus]|uniref:Uncharacterized protein n=1 Tax=Araneus ventricosus TaxID=182803 RepID=A0A4Y2D9I6_ARAVE|nr:hypothetical protein AVEN_114973-1 [Araneus ventricosus]